MIPDHCPTCLCPPRLMGEQTSVPTFRRSDRLVDDCLDDDRADVLTSVLADEADDFEEAYLDDEAA